MPNYDVKFTFDCVSKRGMISRKKGQLNVYSDIRDHEELKNNPELISLIAFEMNMKTKKVVMSVSDIEVIETLTP